MAIQPTDANIEIPFALNGEKNTIGKNPVSTRSARFTQSEGFPQITEVPLNQSGLPPLRKDFNGALYMLSASEFFEQHGGVWEYSRTKDYNIGNCVMGSDGNIYYCAVANGVSSTVSDPVEDTEHNHWYLLYRFHTNTMNGPVYSVNSIQADAIGNVDVKGVVVDEAETAKRLKTPRSIALSDDVTGSAQFDGSKDITIKAKLAKTYVQKVNNIAPDSTGNVTITIPNQMPPGLTGWFAGRTAPDGWLICNGQAVSRTTYSALFSQIGTIYGAGNGSTTFNLPNMMDRTVWGANGSSVGVNKAAGLPNITGTFSNEALMQGGSTGVPAPTGAFYNTGIANSHIGGSDLDPGNQLTHLDASRSSSIYGNSSTVQPPALCLLPCIKY